MLDENAVIEAVCRHLEQDGFEIEERLHTTEHGVDVIARNKTSGKRLFVEAKGGTSSREGSNRFGKPFTQTQVFDRVAKALYTAVKLHDTRRGTSKDEVALAFPDTEHFLSYLRAIAKSLNELGVKVFVVHEDKRVSVFNA